MVKMLLLFNVLKVKGDIPERFTKQAVCDMFAVFTIACPASDSHRGFVAEVPAQKVKSFQMAVHQHGGTAHFLNGKDPEQWLPAHGLDKR